MCGISDFEDEIGRVVILNDRIGRRDGETYTLPWLSPRSVPFVSRVERQRGRREGTMLRGVQWYVG